MHKDFIITKRALPNECVPEKMKLLFHNSIFFFYSFEGEYQKGGSLMFYFDGYILPRYNNVSVKNIDKNIISKELAKQGTKIIEIIKGIFCLIIWDNDKITLYTDHFGIYKFYYSGTNDGLIVTNNFNLLVSFHKDLDPDTNSLMIKSLIHRNINEFTSYKNIFQSIPASIFEIGGNGYNIKQYWDYSTLLDKYSSTKNDIGTDFFADLMRSNFDQLNSSLKPKSHSITLTGGKDSRTGLAALLSLDIIPAGFTYGNPLSKDVIFAGGLAEKLSLEHHIFNPPETEDWFESITKEIISYGNPEISIHRTHRFFAFKAMSAIAGKESAFYPGYMAGEFLMGVYYDDLVFTRFLTNYWDTSVIDPIDKKLKEYYHRFNGQEIEDLKQRIFLLKTFDPLLSKPVRQYHGMFEIGIPHHSQDIFLAHQCFDYVYPFFIDIDLLEALFNSRFSFFFTDNRSINPLKRYRLFEFNLIIQHLLYPGMDNIPFGKKGSYNTNEYLKGMLYWTIIKTARYLFQNIKYPVNYTYGPAFRNFLAGILSKIEANRNHFIHEYYDITRALSDLNKVSGYTGEKDLHKYSNIVLFYLQSDALQYEV